MNQAIVSAIFEDRSDAEQAIYRLRSAGFTDESISVIGRHGETSADEGGEHHVDNKGTGALKGLGVGAGVGAIFGLTALVIPGVGPFIAAGSLLEGLGVLGSAAASGAIVGGTAGGIAGALMKYGVSEEDASYYEERIKEGGIWVAVDTRRTVQDAETAADILHAAGGRSARHSRRVEAVHS